MRAASELNKHMDDKMSSTLDEIHTHLATQDEKLDMILKVLEVDYDKNKETG